jgi:uncharacterized repeat protein (TIGR03803 family)
MSVCAQGASGQVAYELLHAFAIDETFPFLCRETGFPLAGLVEATDGQFFGTTAGGGPCGVGTVFKITAAGTFTILHSFDCSDGCEPVAGLIQASDGAFYGTTSIGGMVGAGTVFRITAAGAFTTLHSFENSSTEGARPLAGLIQASDGDFYGTTFEGGARSGGTVYKITAAGAVTTLYSFETGGIDGSRPEAGLIQANDGDFYGTTGSDGAGFCGTVFKITAAGTLTTLHPFGQSTDGCSPRAGLIQASDGNLYGTTSRFGSAGAGTVFKITTSGALTTLHSFGGGISEGTSPVAGLIQASDGNLYGTTESGGAFFNGTIFKITGAGTLTTLYSFAPFGIRGALPVAGLIQATDGNLYGTARTGFRGEEGGVVFRLVPQSSVKVWIGLKNSDDVGLRLDLLAEVVGDGIKIGEGRLDNVSAGSSGFSNAVLRAIPIALTNGPLDFPVVAMLEVKVSMRRTCVGGGHTSGITRLWYNGPPTDSGAKRDVGSRLDAVRDLVTVGHFLRGGFALSTTPGTSRQSIDVVVDTKETCPNRPFKSVGTWSNNRYGGTSAGRGF